MNRIILSTSILLIVSFNSLAESGIPKQALQEARATVKSFAEQLKGALKPAMKKGGPVEAISVCQHQAGPIAESVSAKSDWLVSRTSLKARNEANQADAWELKVLQTFEQRKADGENIKTMEYSERVVSNDKPVYRYMKAIPTGELCLKCHGSSLDSAVSASLKKHYPNDLAVGFNKGDIRGAFSLQKAVKDEPK